ncbi:DUF456 domain-containing protein [Joostella atrarenae]|uniref:DUF456 domain-containing protein n=1 Tax=Joostella atrarenae TaxID=679257 RepID=A0ABS9IZJ8_9FLAO|nr:DUF456 domain-containing protein [Joostella atrarenae]MCF8713597.1 DUF456 domain-containing protein [Joostella atrarenae]
MDIFLVVIGFLCVITGILGSFLPVLPGAPISWVGLLLLYLTKVIPNDWWMLGITLIISIAVVIADYIIPVAGTKRFGGSKYGMIGTTVGLIVSIVFPILGLFGIVIWPFVGAFIGELINKADSKTALKAAFGSFLGFLTGTFLKLIVALAFLVIFVAKVWEYKSVLF